jgi:Flp pilus assembly protein TadB
METALAIAGFVIGLVALAIAIWEVRDARRLSQLLAEITIIKAYLDAELEGQRRPEVLRDRFDRLQTRACELAGSESALEDIIPGVV